eukprot:Nitzschia sp. Nitz4//scaffold26_size159584//101683//103329//NITZ4_002500-RA/size159584-processed-gene-0.80-mRNA-1//-1//CDS//3329545109//1552//frame0
MTLHPFPPSQAPPESFPQSAQRQFLRRPRSNSFEPEFLAHYESINTSSSHPSSGARVLLPPVTPKPEPTPLPLGNSPTGNDDDRQPRKTPHYVSSLYGILNATIVIPVVMSFGAIIYQDPAFAPYTPVLIQLTLVSGVIHQLAFVFFSSLEFAVGSVQDAGLIFLSHMATQLVHDCGGVDNMPVVLATTTIGLSLCTALLGVALVIIGKLRLAGYVQLLPTSVMAGYLAFIGYFCFHSGIRLMLSGSKKSDSLGGWVLVLPGVLGGLLLYISVQKIQHVVVLPVGMILLLVCFYSALLATDTSIDQAIDSGWIREAESAPIWYHTWDYLKFDKVMWSALPRLISTEISMILVVALSSSLDIAAIDLELKHEASTLDYNPELATVGISNIISGLTGGYTGSYIFSQTIFTLRSGVRSRVAGFVLAMVQAILIVIPVPIVSLIPNFFYGALLTMIGLDLMIEWLWGLRRKVSNWVEYSLGLATFACVQLWGVEGGIVSGVVLYLLCRPFIQDHKPPESEPSPHSRSSEATSPKRGPSETSPLAVKSSLDV